MPDREKIICAIERAKRQSEEYAQDCIVVPFKEAEMIISLLKEQEPDETRFVHRYSRPGVYVDLLLHCEKCDGTIENHTILNYCPWCGRKVKWDD